MFPRETENSDNRRQVEINEELKKFPGKEIFDSYFQWLSSKDKRPFLSTSEFSRLLTSPKVILDKDVYLDLGVFIENPITVSGGESHKKIYIYNSSVAFSVFSDNVSFENIDFYLTNVNFFLQSRTDKINRMPQGISFKNCKFFIYGKTNLTFESSNLKIDDSLFVSERKTFIPESSLLWIVGSNIEINHNTFIDFSGSVNYPIYVGYSDGVKINNNVVVTYQEDMKGLITISESKNILISSNFLQDTNPNPKSLSLSKAPVNEEDVEIDGVYLEGGVGVWYSQVENIKIEDNLLGVENVFFDQKENKFKKTEKLIKATVLNDFSLDCRENEKLIKFLDNNHYLKCQKP